jgi:hypothetical protein
MLADTSTKRITANVLLARPGAPKELHVKFRLPKENMLQSVTVNGQPAKLGGTHNDMAILSTGNSKSFEIAGRFT